jgi:hypothetical protein
VLAHGSATRLARMIGFQRLGKADGPTRLRTRTMSEMHERSLPSAVSYALFSSDHCLLQVRYQPTTARATYTNHRVPNTIDRAPCPRDRFSSYPNQKRRTDFARQESLSNHQQTHIHIRPHRLRIMHVRLLPIVSPRLRNLDTASRYVIGFDPCKH